MYVVCGVLLIKCAKMGTVRFFLPQVYRKWENIKK